MVVETAHSGETGLWHSKNACYLHPLVEEEGDGVVSRGHRINHKPSTYERTQVGGNLGTLNPPVIHPHTTGNNIKQADFMSIWGRDGGAPSQVSNRAEKQAQRRKNTRADPNQKKTKFIPPPPVQSPDNQCPPDFQEEPFLLDP